MQLTRIYKDVSKGLKRVNMLRGGTRSTKSYSLTQMAVRWLIYGKVGDQYIPIGDWFIIRESFPALRRTVLKDFTDILHAEKLYKFVDHIKTTHQFNRHGRSVSFFSADDTNKIHGAQSNIFWINEATAVSFDVFFQLIIRCGQFCFLDYNPMDSESWVKELEEGKKGTDLEDIQLNISTVHDNPFLSEPQMKSILSIQDEDLRKVYLEGKWAKLSGLIYPKFEQVDNLPEDFSKRYFGLDFGWIDPTALIEVRQIENNLYIKEHLYESKYDLDQLAGHIYAYLPACKGAADSAAPRHIHELKQKGIRVKPAKKGPDSILQGIIKVKSFNIYVTKDSVNLIKELRSYKWQKDKEGNEIQKPIDDYNHALDALRYAVTTYGKRSVFNLI